MYDKCRYEKDPLVEPRAGPYYVRAVAHISHSYYVRQKPSTAQPKNKTVIRFPPTDPRIPTLGTPYCLPLASCVVVVRIRDDLVAVDRGPDHGKRNAATPRFVRRRSRGNEM